MRAFVKPFLIKPVCYTAACLAIALLLPMTAQAQWRPDPKPGQVKSASPFALPAPGQSGKLEHWTTKEKKKPAEEVDFMAKGLELAGAGQYKMAQDYLVQAAKADPENPKVWNNLGLVLRRLGRVEPAVGAYVRAIQADPNFAVAYKNLGVALEASGKPGDALKAYRHYLKTAPKAVDAETVRLRIKWLKQKYGL